MGLVGSVPSSESTDTDVSSRVSTFKTFGDALSLVVNVVDSAATSRLLQIHDGGFRAMFNCANVAKSQTKAVCIPRRTTNSADLKCCICWDPFWKPLVTPCGHLSCAICLIWWLARQSLCPICRGPLYASQLKPLDNSPDLTASIKKIQKSYLQINITCPKCRWEGKIFQWESHWTRCERENHVRQPQLPTPTQAILGSEGLIDWLSEESDVLGDATSIHILSYRMGSAVGGCKQMSHRQIVIHFNPIFVVSMFLSMEIVANREDIVWSVTDLNPTTSAYQTKIYENPNLKIQDLITLITEVRSKQYKLTNWNCHHFCKTVLERAGCFEDGITYHMGNIGFGCRELKSILEKDMLIWDITSWSICLFDAEDPARVACKWPARLFARTHLIPVPSSPKFVPEWDAVASNFGNRHNHFPVLVLTLEKPGDCLWLSIELKSDRGVLWHVYPEKPRYPTKGFARIQSTVVKLAAFLVSVEPTSYHPRWWSGWEFLEDMLLKIK